jgi:hypothetical protein
MRLNQRTFLSVLSIPIFVILMFFASGNASRVYADYCSGTIRCGLDVVKYKCSVSGASCSNPGYYCSPMSAGTCGGGVWTCDTTQNNQPCSAYTSSGKDICNGISYLNSCTNFCRNSTRPSDVCSWVVGCTLYSQGCGLGCTTNERMCNPCTGLCTCTGAACPIDTLTPTPTPTPTPIPIE